MNRSNRIIGIQIRLMLASWAACLFGAVVTVVFCLGYQFDWTVPIPFLDIPLWLTSGLVAVFVLVGVRIILSLRLLPLWRWIRKGGIRTPLDVVPLRVQRDALNLPAYFAGYVWFMWLILAVFLALLGERTTRSFLEIVAGVGVLAGFSSSVLEYFLVEWIWRSSLPQVFHLEDLTRIPAFRLRLRARMLFLFALSIIPLFLSVLLVRSRTMDVLLGSGGILMVLLLTWLSSMAVARPLETITPQMVSFQKGKLDEDVHVEVTSNDEIGALATHFNKMVESVRLRNNEVETIYHISQEITESLELNATLQAILEEVRNIIPYDGAEICLYDKQDNLLHVGAWASSAQVIIDTRGRTYKLGEGYTGWVGENRKSLLIPDVDAHHGHKPTIRQIAEGVFLNGYLGVPLVVKGNKMVGTLELVSTKKSVFDEHSQQILEIIAPQAAIAIDNAEQVIARERELKAQIERLKIEIDDAKRAKQVADITETAYFRNLKEQAQKLRKAAREEESGEQSS
jgi:HAMP domain-containing protein